MYWYRLFAAPPYVPTLNRRPSLHCTQTPEHANDQHRHRQDLSEIQAGFSWLVSTGGGGAFSNNSSSNVHGSTSYNINASNASTLNAGAGGHSDPANSKGGAGSGKGPKGLLLSSSKGNKSIASGKPRETVAGKRSTQTSTGLAAENSAFSLPTRR